MIVVHTFLAGLFVGQAALLARRDNLMFALLLFACMYFLYFAFAPMVAPDQMNPMLEDVVGVSSLFLAGANLLAFYLQLLWRNRRRTDIALSEEAQHAALIAGKVLFWIAVLVAGSHMLIAGIPILQDNVNIARHEVAGSGYIRIFLTRALPLAVLIIVSIHALQTGRILNRRSAVYIAVAVVLIFAQGFRVHLMYLFLYFLSLRFILNSRLSFTLIGFFGILIVSLFMALSAFRFETLDAAFLLERFEHRVSYELLRTTGYAMQITETDGLWYGGTLLMDLHSALPGPGISFGEYMLTFVDPGSVIVGLAALTPSVVGEAYVNFGLFGAFVFGQLTVLLFAVLPGLMMRAGGLAPALAALIPVTFTQLIEVGYGQILASRFLPLLVFILVAVVVYRQALSRRAIRRLPPETGPRATVSGVGQGWR